jgi:hypothetical protein
MTVLLAGAALPSSADAGIRARCRKACKPMVAACVSTTGQSRRACKRVILRACRLDGVEFCDLDSGTNTTTTPSSPTSTTTTLPEAPGQLDFDVDDISRDASTDPGVYSFVVTVAADADSVPVSLDPTAFYVLDDQDRRYEAHPAVAAATAPPTTSSSRTERSPAPCTSRCRSSSVTTRRAGAKGTGSSSRSAATGAPCTSRST